jgi:ubiquinone/menaquinone biosynthesis C-methylase UbiE
MPERHPTHDQAADAAEVAHMYDRWATRYEVDRNETRDLDAAVLRRSSLRVRGRDVLELGCGTGKNTRWLAGEARALIAMDFSVGMLQEARRNVRAPNVTFLEHDVRVAWPVADASADVVVGNLILEHIRDLGPVFAECARVLRRGGQLYLSELHPLRQLRGGHAHFTDPRTRETVHVPAFRHSVTEFVSTGLAAGLKKRELDEWLETDAKANDPPRLLTMLFDRS